MGGGPSRRSSRFLLIAGTLNVIDDVGAVSNAQFLAQGHHRARTAAAHWRVPSARPAERLHRARTPPAFQGSASSIGPDRGPRWSPQQKRLVASIGTNHPGDPTPTPPNRAHGASSWELECHRLSPATTATSSEQKWDRAARAVRDIRTGDPYMSSTTETRKSHVGNADGASAPATVHDAELQRLPRDPIGLGAGALLWKADLSLAGMRKPTEWPESLEEAMPKRRHGERERFRHFDVRLRRVSLSSCRQDADTSFMDRARDDPDRMLVPAR